MKPDNELIKYYHEVLSMQKISKFMGKYSFLSNFHLSLFIYNNTEYKSVEHFYQSHKPIDSSESDRIRHADTPGKAKRIGNKCTLKENWDEIKDNIMFLGLLCKFTQNPNLKNMLLSTNCLKIEEANSWGDVYWGTVNGFGKNKLGKMLEEIRDILRRY